MPANAPATASADNLQELAAAGKRRLDWAFQAMPVLQAVRKQFIKAQPLAKLRVAVSVRIMPETANLLVTLRDGGAIVALSSSAGAPDDLAATLARDYGIAVHASDSELLSGGADVVIEAGGALTSLAAQAICGVATDSAGAVRSRALGAAGALPYPVIAAETSRAVRLVCGQFGAGQSTVDALLRTTNLLLPGKMVVVCGYGAAGRGVAARLHGMGAIVVVTEVDPVRALEATLEGFRVMPLAEAAQLGELILTAAECKHVVAREHFEKMKDGAIVANAGRLPIEIDTDALRRAALSHRPALDWLEEYKMRDGRRIYLLAGGLPLDGQEFCPAPPATADIACAAQALAVEYLLAHRDLPREVHAFPEELDALLARLKLAAAGSAIDKLTVAQEEYLAARADGS